MRRGERARAKRGARGRVGERGRARTKVRFAARRETLGVGQGGSGNIGKRTWATRDVDPGLGEEHGHRAPAHTHDLRDLSTGAELGVELLGTPDSFVDGRGVPGRGERA